MTQRAIIAGHKRFENRSWSTNHRGELAIHASNSKSSDTIAIELFTKVGITPPTIDKLVEIRGKVIGLVNLVDVLEFETADDSVRQDPFTSGPLCFQAETRDG